MEDEKILIRNASQVVTCSGFEAKKGKAMSDVGVIEDGAVPYRTVLLRMWDRPKKFSGK